MSSIDPNREKLSKLIDECDYHDGDIRSGLTTLNDDMQKYRLEQKQYDLIRDTFKEVDIANAHRLERLYKYQLAQTIDELEEEKEITYKFKTAYIDPSKGVHRWEREQMKKARQNMILQRKKHN